MNYSDLLSRSWRITWNHKFLWILGFLAALTRVSSNSNSNYQQSFTNGQTDIGQILQITTLLFTLACIAMIVGLIIWLVSLVAKGGLISAVSRIDNGEKVTFGDAFRAGTAKIGSLVGMNLALYLPFILLIIILVGLMIFAIVGLAGGAAFSAEEIGSAVEETMAAGIGIMVLCLCGFIIVLAIVGILLSFINAFAFRGIMLQDFGALDSLSHGWQVFRNNLGEVLLLSVLFVAINIGFGLLAAIVLVPASLLLVIPAIGTAISGGDFTVLSGIWLIGGGICLGFLGAALFSIVTTWQSASFTLAYEEWTNKPAKSVEV